MKSEDLKQKSRIFKLYRWLMFEVILPIAFSVIAMFLFLVVIYWLKPTVYTDYFVGFAGGMVFGITYLVLNSDE